MEKTDFGDDEEACVGVFRAEGGEEFPELVHVVVWKDAQRGFGHAGGIDEGCVGELVEEEEVAFPGDDRDGGKGGGVAGGEDECRFGIFRGGDGFLKRGVGVGGAGDEPGCAGAGAKFRDAIRERGGDGGVEGEAEIVVGGEVPEFASAAGDAEVPAFAGGEAAEEVFPFQGVELSAGIHRNIHHSATGRSRAQRRSFSESDQMLGVFDLRTTQATERPLSEPVEIRQRPETLVVPVFMPSQ